MSQIFILDNIVDVEFFVFKKIYIYIYIIYSPPQRNPLQGSISYGYCYIALLNLAHTSDCLQHLLFLSGCLNIELAQCCLFSRETGALNMTWHELCTVVNFTSGFCWHLLLDRNQNPSIVIPVCDRSEQFFSLLLNIFSSKANPFYRVSDYHLERRKVLICIVARQIKN